MRFFNFLVVLMTTIFSIVTAAPTAIEPVATLNTPKLQPHPTVAV